MQKYEEEMIEKLQNPGSDVDEYVGNLETLISHKFSELQKLQNEVHKFKGYINTEKNIYFQLDAAKKQFRNS